jgi:hypothetical protein
MHEDPNPNPIWAYRIDKAAEDVEPDRARISTGRGPQDWKLGGADIAAFLAHRARIEHSTYTGPLTVTVWSLGDDLDDEARSPYGEGAAPEDAEVHRFPAVEAYDAFGKELDDRRRARLALRMLDDLDRCAHGRHSIDPCMACPGGQSTGNLFAPPGRRIGTDRYGSGYYVPANREDRHDPKNWGVEPDDPAAGDDPQTSALYRERAHLVAALCALRPSTMVPDPENAGWGIVYVAGVEGQMSWHIAPEDLELFRGVVRWQESFEWDGHTTEEKYRRLRAQTTRELFSLDRNDAERRAAGIRIPGVDQAPVVDTDPQPSATAWAEGSR